MLISTLSILIFTSVCSSLFGYYFGRTNVYWIAIISLFIAFSFSIFFFYEIILSYNLVTFFGFSWFVLGIYVINFSLYLDTLTSVMLTVILSISLFVHIYSVGYLEYDPYLIRFIFFLSFFTFFMVFLVFASNFLQLFVGWEGVGLSSYLLINFWFTRIAANKAALKAMIVNRIADVIFILGIILILLLFYNTDYSLVFDMIDLYLILGYNTIVFFNFSLNTIDLITFFLFIGGVGKSAQLGLHTWLPDAMEGPTPVSSLLHAATMVTAGIFLIIRCSYLFELSNKILIAVILIGGFTSFFAGLIGIFQYDIKKVIAFSTSSQLGYMFFAAGLSYYQIAITHLFNHAFFKSLLFLSAGSIIHALNDEQDMRRMGSLVNILPVSYISMVIGSLSIMGFPFFTGFYSKDLLLELTFARYIIESNFVYFLGVASAMFTSIYSIRLLMYVFFLDSAGYRTIVSNAHESVSFMFFSIFILSLLTIFVGYIFSDLFMGWGTFFWNKSLFLLPTRNNSLEALFISSFFKNLPFMVTIFGFFFTIFIFKFFEYNFYFHFNIASFFYHAGFFNTFYNILLIKIFYFSYIYINKLLDKGFFDFPYLFYVLFKSLNNILRSQELYIFFYIFFMFLGLVLILITSYFYEFSFFLLNIYLLVLNLIFNKK